MNAAHMSHVHLHDSLAGAAGAGSQFTSLSPCILSLAQEHMNQVGKTKWVEVFEAGDGELPQILLNMSFLET